MATSFTGRSGAQASRRLGVPAAFATEVEVIPETVANEGTSRCGNVGGSYSHDPIGRVSEVRASYLAAP